MPSASLSVSSQSGKKLRTCTLEAKPIENVRDPDKENITGHVSRCVSITGTQKYQGSEIEQSSPQLPQLPSEKKCPQTPANRIPLAELIGNTEDAFNCDPKDTTPEDLIFWQHAPTPRSSVSSAAANSARRKKKRARSSSPASCSQNHQLARSNLPETLDLKIMPESLKAPHNDPALDLWARYTGASLTNRDADGNALQAFAHLITSSPQTPSITNVRDSGLRRSISCGIEWPASKAKKRRINHEVVEGKVKDVFAASKPDIMAPGKSKASRILLLMEKLQENSTKVPQIEVSGPSSSSPLPGRIPLPNLAESPVPKRSAAPQESDEAIPAKEANGYMQENSAKRKDYPDCPSSEFGDEDLALDALEAVEQSACTQATSPAPQRPSSYILDVFDSATLEDHAGSDNQSVDCQSPHRPGPTKPLSALPDNVEIDAGPHTGIAPSAFDCDDGDDEFGGESDENDVMADLAAQFDTQHTTCTSQSDRRPEQAQAQQGQGHNSHVFSAEVVNDDNAYDDDDDDELWNEIGDGSILLEQNGGLVSASHVRVMIEKIV